MGQRIARIPRFFKGGGASSWIAGLRVASIRIEIRHLLTTRLITKSRGSRAFLTSLHRCLTLPRATPIDQRDILSTRLALSSLVMLLTRPQVFPSPAMLNQQLMQHVFQLIGHPHLPVAERRIPIYPHSPYCFSSGSGTQPIRLASRKTCVSMAKQGCCMQNMATQAAVLTPMPGRSRICSSGSCFGSRLLPI